jgi:chromosome segregation ATPase
VSEVADPGSQALAAYARRSMRDTRHKLDLAVRRLVHGNPRVVPKGTTLSAASVAKEAGVDRATLYRFHEPILAEIRRVNEAAPRDKLRASRAQNREADTRLKEYRKLLEQAQSEVAALARINYRLQTRVEELETSLRVRDERLATLQRQLNTPSKFR